MVEIFSKYFQNIEMKTTVYNVVISKRAETNLDAIVLYLATEWNEKVKTEFLDDVKKITKHLSKNPFMYQEFSASKQIRRCFITKHNALYFRVVETTVQIISIHDTRKNPKSIKL